MLHQTYWFRLCRLRTSAMREIFLRVLGECGNVSASAEAAGIGRNALYDWRRDDPKFAAAWEEALVVGADALEDEAKRRAMDGSDAPHVPASRPKK
jgi:hypothetical protein